MDQVGYAVFTRPEDGSVTVERADPLIGVSLALLAAPGGELAVDGEGFLLLAGDREHRYRPVRFMAAYEGGPPITLVCERVEGS